MTGVDWRAIEEDVDEDGLVESITQADDGAGGTIGVETRYARLEGIAMGDEFATIEGDDGGDGFVQIRVPWEIIEDLVARRKAGVAG